MDQLWSTEFTTDPVVDEIDYQSIVAASADFTSVVDLSGRYLYCSAASRRVFGWGPSELVGRGESEFVHPDDVAALAAERGGWPSAEQSPADLVATRYRFLCHDGSYRWVEATSTQVELNGSPVIVATVRDITERQNYTAALERRAGTDPLTGVANRAVLMDRLRHSIRRLSRAHQGVLAVLYLDLDRFKLINDSLGHRIGDEVLLKMAERLMSHLRPADTLARLGGDEFVLVAEDMPDVNAAVTLANRVVEAGRETFRVGDQDFNCTVSIGVACTADAYCNAEELLSEADVALYRAKDQGRDRVAVFDDELRTTAVGRLITERMVRRAVDEARIVVEYQPIIELRTGRAVSAEALVRIRDSEDKLWLPRSFLDVAEESGLLITIDEAVLADAMKRAGAWRARFGETEFGGVAINITARHLADSGFRRAIIDQLDASGVPPRALQIELTERVLLEASNSAMSGLQTLRSLGLQVGLDDFGTGYSSLSYLRQFPLDFVKIDKSFIDELEPDPKGRAIVAAIIELSHALGLIVIAEGVETPAQSQILRDLGCDRAQGFLYAASASPAALDELVLAGPGTRGRAWPLVGLPPAAH